MASVSRELRLQVTDSGRCSPATISRSSLLGSTESIRRSLQMEMDSIRAEQLTESVGRTLSNYVSLKAELRSDMEWLSTQQEQLDEASSEVQPLTVWVMGSWGALETMKGHHDDAREYTQRKDEFNKKLLILKIQVVCVKLAYISSVIRQLQELSSKDSRLQTPAEFMSAGYDDWIENNQQVFQLQSKMLEVEADKVRLYKDFCVRHRTRTQTATSKHSFSSQLEMQFGREPEVELTQHRLQEMVGEDADATHISYLDTVLGISESNLSFEACKLKSYIRECWDVQVIDESFPTGVHPDRYQEFMGSLCQYIVDKHSVGRRMLTYDIVYARLEHHLLPAINPLLEKYISRPEEDKRIKQLCDNLRYVTQSKLGIEPACRDTSAAPYYAAVAALKGISLSLTPTKKTYSIVKAAQAVFNRLNEQAVKDKRRPPGADEFMDVWVYAVLKASIPNLGSTVALLKRYSNPSLAFSEAGYYLASVEFATQYILRMNEQEFTPSHSLQTTNLVVCEQTKFADLAVQEDALVEIISPSQFLMGYQLFAVKEWQLNPARFYSTILVPVEDAEAKVRVAVVRVSVTGTKSSQIKHLEKVFLTPELSHTGLSRARTPLGLAVTADLTKLNETLTLIPLPGGDYDQFAALIHRYCSLERLGLAGAGDSLPREHRVQGNTLVDSTGDQNEAAENVEALESKPGGRESQGVEPGEQLFEERSFQYVSLDRVNREVAKALRRLCSTCNLSKTCDNPLEYFIGSTSSMLQDLGYFSVLLEANGVYSDLLFMAVQHFQRDYNSQRANASDDLRLVETGCLTPATWLALQDTLLRAVTNLHRLGFVYSGDALSRDPAEHARFRRFVSDCQAALNMNVLVRGTMGKTTQGEIEARLSNTSRS